MKQSKFYPLILVLSLHALMPNLSAFAIEDSEREETQEESSALKELGDFALLLGWFWNRIPPNQRAPVRHAQGQLPENRIQNPGPEMLAHLRLARGFTPEMVVLVQARERAAQMRIQELELLLRSEMEKKQMIESILKALLEIQEQIFSLEVQLALHVNYTSDHFVLFMDRISQFEGLLYRLLEGGQTHEASVRMGIDHCANLKSRLLELQRKVRA